ncbi:MAG TPA: HYR domain-containing protein, partial [Pyrinomonadaceae bacterium]|nr:HYR domain-containing protein [Pyrinomonadaceae bacterium]
MKSRIFSAPFRLGRMKPSAAALVRLGVFSIFICLLAAAVNFGWAAKSATGKRAVPAEAASINPIKEGAAPSVIPHIGLPLTTPLALQAAPEPSVETYNCATQAAQDIFNLGDKVCVRATGVPAATFPEFQWRVSWVNPAGLIDESDLGQVSTTTEYDYTLPLDEASKRFDSSPGANDGILVNNRGTWRVNLTRANGTIRATAYFTVRSVANPVSDLFVHKFTRSATASVAPGDPIAFVLVVGNDGPDMAQNVHVEDFLPAGASLASFSQDTGSACLPADSQDCTIASLGSGQKAEFTAVYTAGAATGPAVTTASVSTPTSAEPDLNNDNNTATATFEVIAGGGAGDFCVLDCPGNITVVANTTQGGNPGAIVSFSSAEGVGECGEISSTPASGTFFPVGTTSVGVSSTTGGGSCSFTVTVAPAGSGPTITCPADQSVTAPANSSEATVNPGMPTTNPTTGVSVTAQRSDNQLLTAPYPIGTTHITWTVTDASGLSSSCTQRITVNS